jgi:DNA-3-methyladenine glycosylase II
VLIDPNHVASLLTERDPELGRIIFSIDQCPVLQAYVLDENQLFERLSRSIVGQQLSVGAARSIWSKIENKRGINKSLADLFVDLTIDNSSELGLSKQKFRYIRNLSEFHLAGDLRLSELRKLKNEEVIATLVRHPGIGRWTSEMFLIFCLKRRNVFPLGDVGLRRAVSLLHKIDIKDTDTISRVSRKWVPFRSVASWCLWNALDNDLIP